MLGQLDSYAVIKTLHILSATILFGTGIGIAFFMYRARFAQTPQGQFEIARSTVLADTLFTAPAVIIQPVTGIALIVLAGHDPFSFWLLASYGLYVLAGLCWLPVVWIQIELRNLLRAAAETGTRPPPRFHKLLHIWFLLGWPAFIALLAIFFLMVVKPEW